jgi:hypothetical protein
MQTLFEGDKILDFFNLSYHRTRQHKEKIMCITLFTFELYLHQLFFLKSRYP